MYKIHTAYYEKCMETNEDIHVDLLQIRAIPLEPGLPSPATLLFNHPMQGMNRLQINSDNDNEHYEVLVNRQAKKIRNMILLEIMICFQ